jgi:hypothetical protein
VTVQVIRSTMTVILILACVAIGGAELYVARSARKTANRLEKLEAIAVLQDERIESMTARLGDDDRPELDKRLKASVHRIDAELARITEETSKLRERLAVLADAYGRDRRLHQKMIRAIESLERTVAGVFEHTLYQLDRAVARTLGDPPEDGDTVRGIVCGGTGASHDGLVREYEKCSADVGLQVRFQVPGDRSDPDQRHARYYLSGKDPRELERDFLALLDSVRHDTGRPDPDSVPVDSEHPATRPGEAACQSLLRALRDVDTGFAQIGPMVAARTPDALLCGVLTLADCRGFDSVALVGEPSAVADRLSALPAERVRDLTAEFDEPRPEPQPEPRTQAPAQPLREAPLPRQPESQPEPQPAPEWEP